MAIKNNDYDVSEALKKYFDVKQISIISDILELGIKRQETTQNEIGFIKLSNGKLVFTALTITGGINGNKN